MEDIEKAFGDAKANLAKVLVAAELLDLAHRRIVARKVYQLAHLIWNVPYMGGGIKLETMLKNLHDLTQIFYSETMATQVISRPCRIRQNETGGIAARPRQTIHEASADRVDSSREHDWRGPGYRLQRRHSRAGCGQDDIRHERDQFGR